MVRLNVDVIIVVTTPAVLARPHGTAHRSAKASSATASPTWLSVIVRV
jgi:hypothetical protein